MLYLVAFERWRIALQEDARDSTVVTWRICRRDEASHKFHSIQNDLQIPGALRLVMSATAGCDYARLHQFFGYMVAAVFNRIIWLTGGIGIRIPNVHAVFCI